MLGILVAAQVAIVAYAPDTVHACDAIDVSVAVSARSSSVTLLPPGFQPFDVLRASSSSNPRARSPLTEYRFTITTDEVGQFTIPEFEAMVDGERIASRSLQIAVRPPRGRAPPAVVARARIDTSAMLNLRSIARAETVFVGQQATYEVAVFLNQTVRERLRRNPTFYPPEMQAMLAYDLPTSTAEPRRRSTRCFDALVYRRALFPLVSGRLVIPPAQLVYSTGISSSSLLSREESHELQTDSVTIVALDPPAQGRPSEYTGAVGEMRVDARVDSITSRVGDPVLFTVRVTGSGNVKLFPRPVLQIPWAALVAADERVRVDSTDPRIGGVKEFDWVLTPRIAGEFDLPPVRYGYFDPSQRRYEVAVAPPRRLRVAAGALVTADTGATESALGIRTRYAGAASPPVHTRFSFWLVMALVPIPAIAGRLRRRVPRSRTITQDSMRVLRTAETLSDPVMLRRHFVRAVAQRLGGHPEDFTHPGALERALRRAGVSVDTARRAESLLRDLDSAAYASAGTLPPNAAREAGVVARAIDVEALARSELPFWIPALLFALSLGMVAHAAAADNAAAHFARGVSAYVRQDYPVAREAFANAVMAEPASPDAWANFGTASWSASDTALAVFGWRQGLTIEPNAGDLQQRLTLVRPLGPKSPGWVPALPRDAAVWVFAVLWIAVWTFAWISRRAHPWAGRLPLPLAGCALLVGLLAIELDARVSGRRIGVVRVASSLSSDPALGMDRGPSVGTGEVVRVVGRRGAWIRVEATEGREGWIASPRLLLIAGRRVPGD